MKYSKSLAPSTIQRLAKIVSTLNPVELVTPTNVEEEKEHWIKIAAKNGFFTNPYFSYDRNRLKEVANLNRELTSAISKLESSLTPESPAEKAIVNILYSRINSAITCTELAASILLKDDKTTNELNLKLYGYPSNIHVTTVLNTSTISWEGDAEQYEVMYRKKTDNTFTSVPVVGTTVTQQNMEYGAYEFWVCSVNGEDKSIYTVFPVVYIYETDCFDALNMYNATFEYGNWNRTGRTPKGYERVEKDATIHDCYLRLLHSKKLETLLGNIEGRRDAIVEAIVEAENAPGVTERRLQGWISNIYQEVDE